MKRLILGSYDYKTQDLTLKEKGEIIIIYPAILLHLLAMSDYYQVNVYLVLDTMLLVFLEEVRHNHSLIEEMALDEISSLFPKR